ncbi:hypothetical protein SDC9_188572 [bioreactor metagenome]|uniref:Uncharacterized protein n=1 Tax=bioreactor metagenome TaxID=1076179 RepID=A0A645HRD8_9ZZZZ
MNEAEKNKIIARPTTTIERILTIVIMTGGVVFSQLIFWEMICEYKFSSHLFAICLLVGPGSLGWGLSNYKTSKFWDSYYGKRITFRSTK